jgi:hypothetical protein
METLSNPFSTTVAGRNYTVPNDALREMYRMVARSLGSLYKFPTASLHAERTEQNRTAYKLML